MAVFFVFNTRFARVNVKGGQRNNLRDFIFKHII